MKIHIAPGFGCRLVQAADSAFHHQFGGGQEYRGTTPKGGPKPVQLLFRLNLEDPGLPVRIEGIKWLPLFYAFQYDASRMGYRIRSDTEIEILKMETLEFTPGFPFADYPAFFPATPVGVVPIQYEEQRALALHGYLQRHLFPREALKAEDRAIIDKIGFEFTRIGRGHDLVQGYPRLPCPDSSCASSRYEFAMDTFATVWNEPIKGIDVWQSGGEPIQIIYQVCPDCAAIQTLNQCT
jgi:hypothetical protein